MKEFTYKKADAFVSGESLGNPAAFLMIDNNLLSHEEMLSIGKHHKGFVSEVVFCSESDKADVKLTYYSSECEVDFCGHGTIAAMYILIKNNKSLYYKDEITIDTNKKGLLTIYNKIVEEDAIYITAPQAQYLDVPVSKQALSAAMDIDINVLSDKYRIDFINAGLKTLIVPIKNYEDEISIFPNEAKLKDFCLSNSIDIILIFSKNASSNEFIAHTRVFAPKFGYLEDPATGSGNSAFGYYMLKNKMWDGTSVAVEQGGNDRIFNTVKLMTKNNCVLFGGNSELRIDGKYYLK